MELEEIRKKIDNIDSQIVELLNKRFEQVIEVGKWKNNRKHAIYVPEREKSLLEKLRKLNTGPLPAKTLNAIYREVMSGAIALEHPVSIAFLGPETSFCQLAALKKFGRSVKYFPKNLISDIFKEIETERIDYGIIPIENSAEGVVNSTLDMFVHSDVKICSEINMTINHNLIANCAFSDIEKLYTNYQVKIQCENWIIENFKNIEIIEVSSSAKAAQYAKNDANSAAIASSLSAEFYKLNILKHNIQDNSNNITRFLVIGKQSPKLTGDDKTSLCFTTNNDIGALYECLFPFKEKNIVLSMIESRSFKMQNNQNCFFIDIEGHISENNVKMAIENLNKLSKFIKILGSYPKSEELF